MLVNKKKSSNRRVKFISYDGEYPNLCSGVLVLEIDGKEYKFGHDYSSFRADEDPNNPNLERFWRSGGSVSFSDNWDASIWDGEWEIDVDSLPEHFWGVADEIDEVINENIPWGCCGGCFLQFGLLLVCGYS